LLSPFSYRPFRSNRVVFVMFIISNVVFGLFRISGVIIAISSINSVFVQVIGSINYVLGFTRFRI
jgi:hypothetical protein